MRKSFFLILILAIRDISFAQHCPWDCTGMILIKTNAAIEKIYKISPVLVDENKKEIIDTIYGTGKDTYDSCVLLSYEDFTDYRAKKMAIHYWYGYDTIYHFAAGGYIIKFNYCKYQGKKLYLRFSDLYAKTLIYHYIEIPQSKRMHLHNYNNELTGRETEKLKKLTMPFIVKINCAEWKLNEKDCN